MPLTRRLLLAAGAAGLVAAARPARAADPSRAAPDWAALDASLDGSVERPGTAAYDSTRRLYDPRFDTVRPPAVARCAHEGDVAEAIRFARRSGVAVVPRGGGHSYVGASTSATGLVLDVRRLGGVSFDAATATATIGGGARLIDVYDRLGARGVSVPSGSCGTVGISGITSGGGIGMASAAYGLTCDVVTAARMVTADGRVRAVDAAREPDLFWALRGGGGGQFGVVTSWRMRTFRVRTAAQFTLTYPWSDAPAVAAGWQTSLRSAGRAWSTCQFTTANGRLGVRINGFVPDGAPGPAADAIVRAIRRDPASTDLSRRPYLDVVHDRAGCDDDGDCGPRGTEIAGSDIFAGPLPASAIAGILAAVRDRARTGRPGVAKLKQMTGAPARIRQADTAFPWRGAHTMLQWLVLPAADAADAYAWVGRGHRAVAAWSLGRYVNYLEPDRAAVPRYHGPHLSRLRRIRATTDPRRLFRSPFAV